MLLEQQNLCIYRQNTTIFISSIIGYLLHLAQLHVSAANIMNYVIDIARDKA